MNKNIAGIYCAMTVDPDLLWLAEIQIYKVKNEYVKRIMICSDILSIFVDFVIDYHPTIWEKLYIILFSDIRFAKLKLKPIRLNLKEKLLYRLKYSKVRRKITEITLRS